MALIPPNSEQGNSREYPQCKRRAVSAEVPDGIVRKHPWLCDEPRCRV